MDTTTKPASIQNSNPNPNSLVAFHFIKALANIHQTTSSTPSSFSGRSRMINRAAYTSMAMAAGPRRAWSQALLERLRGQRLRRQRVVIQRRRARVSRSVVREPNRVESLRRLIPGGRSMDLCCLLGETASYVQCLRDQVKVMQTIADSANFC